MMRVEASSQPKLIVLADNRGPRQSARLYWAGSRDRVNMPFESGTMFIIIIIIVVTREMSMTAALAS